MPSVSKAERRAAAIAEHHPEKLYARNKGMVDMSKEQLHDFAKTKESKLPEKKHEGRGFGKDMRSHHGRKPNPRAGY